MPLTQTGVRFLQNRRKFCGQALKYDIPAGNISLCPTRSGLGKQRSKIFLENGINLSPVNGT